MWVGLSGPADRSVRLARSLPWPPSSSYEKGDASSPALVKGLCILLSRGPTLPLRRDKRMILSHRMGMYVYHLSPSMVAR